MNYSKEIEKLAQELNVDFSVASDIHYLRTYEARILHIAKEFPGVRDFAVYNSPLESELELYEAKINGSIGGSF